MGIGYRTLVFRMELSSHEPFQGRDLDDLRKSCFRVYACGDHAGFFELLGKLSVEFVPVSMSLHMPQLLSSFLSIRICKLLNAWFPLCL